MGPCWRPRVLSAIRRAPALSAAGGEPSTVKGRLSRAATAADVFISISTRTSMETEWGMPQPKGSLYISMLCIVKNDGYSWPHARARNSIRIRCARLIEKQIGDQRAAWLHRVAREIGHAGAREYFLVDVEMAGSLACIGGQNDVRCIGEDVRRAAAVYSRAHSRDHRQRRGRDHGARPKRVDGDAMVAEFLGHSQHAHAHAVLGDGIGDVILEPVRPQVQRWRQIQYGRVAAGSSGRAEVWQARLRAQERAAHVDAEHQVEALHGSCQRGGGHERCWVVY